MLSPQIENRARSSTQTFTHTHTLACVGCGPVHARVRSRQLTTCHSEKRAKKGRSGDHKTTVSAWYGRTHEVCATSVHPFSGQRVQK